MTSLEELIGKDGSLNLGTDFMIRRDDDDLWRNQVYYSSPDIGHSPVGEARLAVMRYMNGTLDPDPRDQALDLAEHLYRVICEVDQRNHESSLTAWTRRNRIEDTVFRSLLIVGSVAVAILIIMWRTS